MGILYLSCFKTEGLAFSVVEVRRKSVSLQCGVEPVVFIPPVQLILWLCPRTVQCWSGGCRVVSVQSSASSIRALFGSWSGHGWSCGVRCWGRNSVGAHCWSSCSVRWALALCCLALSSKYKKSRLSMSGPAGVGQSPKATAHMAVVCNMSLTAATRGTT